MPFPGYTGWTLQIDPSAVAVNRTMLDINNPTTGIQVGGTSSGQGIDFGTSQITEMAAQEGQFGSTVADYILPNRTITIPLGLGMGGPGTPTANSALNTLAQKVGLLQREGGWLLRQRSGGSPLYLDIVDAQLDVPDVWGETGDVEPGVTLTLITLPDWYGDEVQLDSIPVTGFCSAVLTKSSSQADIAGDYPARCRIELTDSSGNQQDGLVWGLQSRYYDSAATAALAFAATSLTAINGAASASNAAAYGGSVVKVEPSSAGTWWPFLALETGSKLTHQGSYRVLVRAMSATEAAQLQLSWGSTGSSVLTVNTAAQLPVVNEMCVLDLGVVRIDAPPVGSNAWIGTVAAQVATADDDVQVDQVWLVPLAECAGSLSALSPSGSSAITSSAAPTGFANSGAGTAWTAGSGLYTVTPSGSSELLVCTGLGLNVPGTATVVGVVLSIGREGFIAAKGSLVDNEVKLYSGGSTIGSNRASAVPWPSVSAAQIYGATTDLWGASLTPAIVNASGFGFAFSVTGSRATANLYAQTATLTVYFTLGSVSEVSDAVIYADETLQLTDSGAYRTADGTVYSQASTPVGNLTRIPPSGAEGRPVRLFAKPMRGQFTNGSAVDNGIDTFTVTPYYRPCYLARI